MELGKQIRKYRTQAGCSQEQLAEKIYVSRQTISNWENDRSYPDIHSLVLLSEQFGVSLDELVKGDVEKMKKEITQQERQQFDSDSRIFTLLFVLLLIVPVPLVRWMSWAGLALYLLLFAFTMYFAIRVENYKKRFNIHTYKEIVAFTEGKSLDEIDAAREAGKRPYQKALLAAGCALLVVAIALLMDTLLR